jgi:thiol-disulfide isomerase/thioredoxin
MKCDLQNSIIVYLLVLVFTSYTAYAAETGKAMPDCALSPLGKSETASLKQFKGKVIYVDFWASWCGPCAKSFPFLNEMHQQLNDKGLQIVGVNLDEKPDDAKAFLAKYPSSFTIMADVSKQCAKDFDVKAMPSSYIIDQHGTVQHIHLGFKPGEAKEIRMIVEKLMDVKGVGS